MSPELLAVLSSAGGLAVLLICAFGTPYWSGIAFIDGEVATLIPNWDISRPDPAVQLLSEFKARTVLTITTTLALTVSFLVFGYCLFAIRNNPWVLAAVGVISLGVIVVYFRQGQEEHLFPAYDVLLEAAEAFRDRDSPVGLRLVAFGNTLFVLAALSFVASVWHHVVSFAPLRPRDRIDNDEQLNRDKEIFRAANREMVWHLYLASALLVVSVIALHSYYSWPATLVGEDQAEELRSLATLVALLFGSAFTVGIVVVLGPAVLVLNPRIESFALIAVEYEKTPGVERSVADWLLENGLGTSGSQQSLRVLAALAPVLAGPLMDLLKLTGG